MAISLRDVHHAYGNGPPVLQGVGLTLERGQIGCILGPSGCGKTTLLRCLAGFEPVQRGEIALQDVVVSQPSRTEPPETRGVGVVFQDFALFPHLTVADNIGFGLHKMASEQRKARVAELLDLVSLTQFSNSRPEALSGGQQQRVALARALAPSPELILLDEPFSSLDVDLRERLSGEVRSILKAAGATALLVTHDQHEAFAMADMIGILNHGQIEQWDAAYNLYHRPLTRFIADFVGEGVFIPGTLSGTEFVETEFGRLHLMRPVDQPERTVLDVLVRPDDIIHRDASQLTAKVRSKAFRGADFLYTLELASGQRVLSLVPSHHDHALGMDIGIELEIDHVIAFARPSTITRV